MALTLNKKVRNGQKKDDDSQRPVQHAIKNARDVSQIILDKKNKITECFEKVLELCQIQITRAAENNFTHCIFEVPEFLLGYPMYDINECIVYILKRLKDNDYNVSYFFPKIIYILWPIEEDKTDTQYRHLLNILNSSTVMYKSQQQNPQFSMQGRLQPSDHMNWSSDPMLFTNQRRQQEENEMLHRAEILPRITVQNDALQRFSAEPKGSRSIKSHPRSGRNASKYAQPSQNVEPDRDMGYAQPLTFVRANQGSVQSQQPISTNPEHVQPPTSAEIDPIYVESLQSEKTKPIYVESLQSEKTNPTYLQSEKTTPQCKDYNNVGLEDSIEKKDKDLHIEKTDLKNIDGNLDTHKNDTNLNLRQKSARKKKGTRHMSEYKTNEKFVLDLSLD